MVAGPREARQATPASTTDPCPPLLSGSFLRPGLRSPQAVVREPLCKIAETNFWAVFRGQQREPIRSFSWADAASDSDHDERVVGEAIPVVHAGECSLYVLISQGRRSGTVQRLTTARKGPAPAMGRIPDHGAREARPFGWGAEKRGAQDTQTYRHGFSMARQKAADAAARSLV
jgi:hypothetical protein